MSYSQLNYAKYGKDNVRVMKVHRDLAKATQDVYEFVVKTTLEGEIDTSYTDADNSVIVPTDTQKQTVYIIAKKFPVSPPELFATQIAQHFLDKYDHIHVARVDVEQVSWIRLTIDGHPHPHSFIQNSNEKRIVNAVATKGRGIQIRSGIKDLLVLKSTGSAFYGYDTADPYTCLPETLDRILSTAVESIWTWKSFKDLSSVHATKDRFDEAWHNVRDITLTLFANENSPSVQNTMYKMADRILGENPEVTEVEYTLPNKHYFECGKSHSSCLWHESLELSFSRFELGERRRHQKYWAGCRSLHATK